MTEEQFKEELSDLFSEEVKIDSWQLTKTGYRGYELHLVVTDKEDKIKIRKTVAISETLSEDSLTNWRKVLYNGVKKDLEN